MNWVDLIFILVALYFIFSNRGLINTLIEAFGFIFALGASYTFYGIVGKFLATNFSLPRGLSNAGGFFIAWFIAETIYYFISAQFILPILSEFGKKKWNKILGFAGGFIQSGIIFLFFVSLIFALPVRGNIKKDILDSKTGPFFVGFSQSLEGRLKNVFGDAVSESLNFLTIKPHSTEKLDLGFKVSTSELKYDPGSEQAMLTLINQERAKDGKKPLVFDNNLRDLARSYAMEMFNNGFFAHTSAVDGSNPADRADRAHIEYQVIGENLALAPDVYLAHQGLMNSPGHRANILSDEFGHVGIGVVDGGVYGRIFVQEFTN